MSNTKNNNRIAKNTLFLFFRMFLTMGISLYTTRVVLEILGVEDFGIYNVVGGIVFMMAFLTSSMSVATQRFISFELGKKDNIQLNKIFCTSINIHIIFAVIIFVLAETIGLWFLNNRLVIPIERIEAANWVYQFSVLSFIINIIIVPYNATIIAFERMKVYAYISIVESLLKLIIVFTLLWFSFDKLKIYAVLIFFVSFTTSIIYKIYCRKNFQSTKYSFIWDKNLLKTLLSYSGWNLFGGIAGVTMGQGVNILLNIFFGPTVNAARAIAFQIKGAVNMFVTNFQMAVNPQIVKSYAIDDIKYMHELIFQGSKFSFFLLYIISLPILFETELILKFWLNEVPELTIIFTRLGIINILIDCISGSLMTAAQASGKIKKYQTVIGLLLLMILPISYFLLNYGWPPEVTLYVSISISIVALLARLYIISELVNFPIILFFKEVLMRVSLVILVSLILPFILRYNIESEIIRFFTTFIISILSVIFSIYWFGLIKKEQFFIKKKAKFLLSKLKIN